MIVSTRNLRDLADKEDGPYQRICQKKKKMHFHFSRSGSHQPTKESLEIWEFDVAESWNGFGLHRQSEEHCLQRPCVLEISECISTGPPEMRVSEKETRFLARAGYLRARKNADFAIFETGCCPGKKCIRFFTSTLQERGNTRFSGAVAAPQIEESGLPYSQKPVRCRIEPRTISSSQPALFVPLSFPTSPNLGRPRVPKMMRPGPDTKKRNGARSRDRLKKVPQR